MEPLRLRRGFRRRLMATMLAGAVLMLPLGGCAPAPGASAGEGAGWSAVDDFPLAPREAPVVAWTGEEVLVVGGSLGPPCPAPADCALSDLADDGAALDPESGRWRTIAKAPEGILPWSSAFATGSLFVQVADADGVTLHGYDVEADSWAEWETPDESPRTLIADSDRVLWIDGSDEDGTVPDLVLDVASGRWEELADDPLGEAFDRLITPTPAGLVLTAKELVPDPGAERPPLVIAALLDRETGEWTRLPDTGQIGGWSWVWTGTRMIDAQLGGGDGGRIGNWGRFHPFGGALELPGGAWTPLPDAPDARGDAWLDAASGGERHVISGDHVFDDVREEWTPLGRPAGAAAQAGSAIWAGGVLVVVGGVEGSGADLAHGVRTWTYRPPL